MNKKNLLIIICSFSISAISSGVVNENFNSLDALVVHKTPACGCCKKWMKHLEENGFNLRPEDHQNLNSIKDIHNIKSEYRSCHTAVSSDGFIFEGHIPSKYIKQFLLESYDDAIGLSVPGMPLGSPGMEFENRFMPYEVLILFKDGSSKVYAEVRK
jgi:hypothetical protein